MLKLVENVPQVVRCCATGTATLESRAYSMMVLQPFGRLLGGNAPPALLAQVAHDIAGAIGGCAALHVAHRDITANNIVEHGGRGWLIDFSAAKVGAAPGQSLMASTHTCMTCLLAVGAAGLSA